MVIEYTASPKDVAVLYSYTRKHSFELALIFYGLPICAAKQLVALKKPAAHADLAHPAKPLQRG